MGQLADEEELFLHPPLDGRPNSIRLVRIKRERSQEGRICCDMRVAKVYEEYTCLSYVWGDEKHDAGIEINGCVFKDVQRNLWEFLDAALTRNNNPRWLWIDALCINQSDEKEKNDQVQRMGDIFRNAREVVSWLGNDRHIATLLEKQRPSRRGLEALLSSPYWGRAWITQEVALAPSLTLMSGLSALDFADVARMVDSWEGFKSNTRIEGSRVDPTRWKLYKGESLMLLLQECREKQCRDYHDKIYSLAGLCCESNSIEVDYSISRGQLAVEVLRACHQWFCLCSVTLVGLTLRLVKRTIPRAKHWKRQSRGRSFHTPFAKCMIPVTTLSNGTKSVLINVRSICSNSKGLIELHVLPDTTTVSVAQCRSVYVDYGNSARTLEDGITVKLSSDGRRCTVWFSLDVLLEMGRTFQNTAGKSVCHTRLDPATRQSGRVLTLCSDSSTHSPSEEESSWDRKDLGKEENMMDEDSWDSWSDSATYAYAASVQDTSLMTANPFAIQGEQKKILDLEYDQFLQQQQIPPQHEQPTQPQQHFHLQHYFQPHLLPYQQFPPSEFYQQPQAHSQNQLYRQPQLHPQPPLYPQPQLHVQPLPYPQLQHHSSTPQLRPQYQQSRRDRALDAAMAFDRVLYRAYRKIRDG